MRILIADDDMASRKFLAKYLSKLGEVDIACNGVEAVDKYVANASSGNFYDLVCLDIMMPKIDGFKVLQAIRDAEKKIEVPIHNRPKTVMISSLDEEGCLIDDRSSEFEYDGYICKPVMLEDIDALMKKIGIVS